MGGLTVAGFVPLCMDADELAGWRDVNARAGGGGARIPCADCSLGFAAEMRAVGKCNGTPAGVADEEDEEMDTTPTLADLATTKARIAVTAPCEACGHAPVCRLRPEVEAVAAATVAVPKLGSGLRLELAGTVACDWFARAPRPKPAGGAAEPPKPRRELSPEERQAAAARMAHARAVAAERKRQEAEAA